jgi:hypothetical protein
MYEYNSETNTKTKNALGNVDFYEYLHKFWKLIIYTIIIVTMIFFETATYDEI